MKKFPRVKEDFVCEKCGHKVSGTGYTNHCPKCLWSKHVDITPGDRRSKCGGLMEPVRVESLRDELIIVHRCTKCGIVKKNTAAPDDDRELLMGLLK